MSNSIFHVCPLDSGKPCSICRNLHGSEVRHAAE